MNADLMPLAQARQQDFLREAENDRLANQVDGRHFTARHFTARHLLAAACERLAQWLDGDPNRYLQPSRSGPADWAGQPTNAYIWLADSVTPPAARDYKHVRRTNS